jgi:Phosphatidylethanolamine-binding protein
MAMTLNSPAFQPNGHIPSKYTCEGEDVSPPLTWEGVPNGAKSLVLIIDDPDAPDPKVPKMVWYIGLSTTYRPEPILVGGPSEFRSAVAEMGKANVQAVVRRTPAMVAPRRGFPLGATLLGFLLAHSGTNSS